MYRSKSRVLFSIFTPIALLVSGTICAAQTCPENLEEAATNNPGKKLFYLHAKKGWLPTNSFKKIKPATRRFAYVNRSNRERNGVLVVKSGKISEKKSKIKKHVKLIREKFKGDRDDKCYTKRVREDFEGKVKTRNYDLYHRAIVFNNKDVAVLKKFHVNYKSKRTGECTSTDSIHNEPYGNRYQYSFNQKIVSDGRPNLRDRVATSLTPAFAADDSKHLHLQRVETRLFKQESGGFVCNIFDLPVHKEGTFVRISDLEDRDLFKQRPREFEAGGR